MVARKKPARSLPEREAELVRGALARVRALPVDMADEEAVLRIIRIRNALEKNLERAYDPAPRARRIVTLGFFLSLGAGAIVIGVALWLTLARINDPVPGLEDPVRFLTVFGGLFLASWLPLVLSLVRASQLRADPRKDLPVNKEQALLVFDVAVVRGLVRLDADAEAPSSPG